MNEVIERDDKLIGSYTALYQYLCKYINERVEEEYWEEVVEMAQLLLELERWHKSSCQLIIDDHNGMGYTVSEFNEMKGEEDD